jgi:hypothetical protein
MLRGCRTRHPQQAVRRLEKLGARRERQEQEWHVMRDPAGLLFASCRRKPARWTTTTRSAGTDALRAAVGVPGPAGAGPEFRAAQRICGDARLAVWTGAVGGIE